MRRIARLLPLFLVGALGCKAAGDLPASFVSEPRVIAIKAEPPEVPPGGSSTVTAVVVGTDGETPVVSWSRCRRAPLPGQAINPDCLADGAAPYLEPVGEGVTITTTMPADITPDALGLPDSSGGVYLPLVAHVTVGGQTFISTYRLRLGPPTGGNQNPTISGVYVDDPSGPTPLDEAVPRIVHAGDRLTVSVSLTDGSYEVYVSPVAGPTGGPVTESPTSSWFSSAGEVSNANTNGANPTMELTLDKRLPATGSLIDLYVVTRDERGGTDYAHRTLQLQ